MRTKRHTAPALELPGEIAQAFNLATQATSDGWRDAAERSQSSQDRQEANRRQVDMFPDVYQPARLTTSRT